MNARQLKKLKKHFKQTREFPIKTGSVVRLMETTFLACLSSTDDKNSDQKTLLINLQNNEVCTLYYSQPFYYWQLKKPGELSDW